jgi:broad specificity phosphatase PhoE
MTATFVIVRHGNTFADGEVARRIGARTDLPLVEAGREQARRLGQWFGAAGWRFDRLLCSPLVRTRETAEIIRGKLADAPPAERSGLLAEIDHGADEDRPESEIIARIGAKALAAWDRDGLPPPGWSVEREARLDGWRDLFAQRQAGTTLLVTSNGAARFALLADPDLARQARALPGLKLRTGAIGIIRSTDTGLQLDAWDQRP